MAMLGDGMSSYDNDKDGSDKQLAGCEVCFISLYENNVTHHLLFRLTLEERDFLLLHV